MTKKITKARENSSVGSYPRIFSAIWDNISDELKDRLTGRELAMVIDLARSQYVQGRADKEKKIVADGAVWDDRNQRFIELENAPRISTSMADLLFKISTDPKPLPPISGDLMSDLQMTGQEGPIDMRRIQSKPEND